MHLCIDQKVFGHIFSLYFWTKLHIKTTELHTNKRKRMMEKYFTELHTNVREMWEK
jgi:hypothetical protein